MKQVILRTGLFLLPILLLLGGLEYIQRQLPNDYTFKKNQFEDGLEQWEVLILGSSHSYLGVNPAQFERPTFNLAYTAQTLAFDKMLLEKYIDQMPRLKFVLFPISYPTYGSESYLYPGIYNKTYYYKHFYGSDEFTSWSDPENYSLLALLTVKKATDQTLRYYKWDTTFLVECDTNGWYGPEFQRNLEENGVKSARFHDLFFDPELYATNEGYLKEMIELCQSRNIQPLLFSTPMWSTYLNGLDTARLTDMVRISETIAQQYGIHYLNQMQDTSYHATDFFDANHLGPKGANRFSLHLDSIIYSLSSPPLVAFP